MPKRELRGWQSSALEAWEGAGHRGIASVVTGGGKTVFALACVDRLRPETTLIVVPTLALLDQWWEEASDYFGLSLDEIHVITGSRQVRSGTINIAVLNTASKLAENKKCPPLFLIVDECHKAGSPMFRSIFGIPRVASLGLSATPERPYDEAFDDVLRPALGDIIVTYSYSDALRDGVIVPFSLQNVVFELEEDRKAEYDKLTKSIARAMTKYGDDAPETVALLLRRARVLNLSLNRVSLTLKIIAAHRGCRTLVFHEDIQACALIHQVLAENGVKAGLYHSKMKLRERAEVLAAFRKGAIHVLVTCRALDEGFNVPETEIGIIAASTATRRQRIQRLGRVLRPASGKKGAMIYTLVTADAEIGRLQNEEDELEGVASVTWSRA